MWVFDGDVADGGVFGVVELVEDADEEAFVGGGNDGFVEDVEVAAAVHEGRRFESEWGVSEVVGRVAGVLEVGVAEVGEVIDVAAGEGEGGEEG